MIKHKNPLELLTKLPQIQLIGPVLILLVYLLVFMIPTLKKFSHLQQQISKHKAEVRNLEQDWANLETIQGNIERLKRKLKYYQKRLPKEKELSQVLQYLSDSARKMDVRITEIKPVKGISDSGKTYYGIPILLKAECGYHQLGRLINELERADRFMKISDLKIEPNLKRRNILSVQLIIVTYVISSSNG